MLGPTKQDFWPRIDILFKGFLKIRMNYGSSKSAKVNFRCQKSTDFFSKKITFKDVNLGDHFLVKTFFLDF